MVGRKKDEKRIKAVLIVTQETVFDAIRSNPFYIYLGDTKLLAILLC